MPDAPIRCPTRTVKAGWIDYNGHMNMAYYLMVFDQSLDHVYDELGIGEAYTRSGQGSCFTREVHVNYLQELTRDDPISVTFQLLDWDAKRLHFFQHMYHAEQNYLAATAEQLALHVDMTSRRTAAFPAAVQAQLGELMQAHQQLEMPAEAGFLSIFVIMWNLWSY